MPIPDDPRLPNAGQIITLVDPKRVAPPTKSSRPPTTWVGRRQQWNGVDITVDARRDKLLIQGGVSTGAYSSDGCDKLAQLPEMTRGSGLNLILEPNGRRGDSRARPSPYRFPGLGREVGDAGASLLGSYLFPSDFQVAATLQNNAGRERQALSDLLGCTDRSSSRAARAWWASGRQRDSSGYGLMDQSAQWTSGSRKA